MKKSKMFAFATATAIFALLLLCGCERQFSGTSASTYGRRVDSPVAGKRVAYVMRVSPSEIFYRQSDGARVTAEALGMEYDGFFCGDSDRIWQNTVYQCAAAGYDGIYLSHGGESYSYLFLMDLLDQFPNLKLVALDMEFLDAEGNVQKIPGVTQFFQQNEEFAFRLVDQILALYPEKVQAGIPVNVVEVWMGPGFLSPWDTRHYGYKKYEESGRINTLEIIAPSDMDNLQESLAEVTAATIAKYDPGEIDAFWCCYDMFAHGVYDGVERSGQNIPLVSVDISNADIEKMSRPNSPWKACAATNWYDNGEFGMRLLALELANEYDKIVDPETKAPTDWIELPTIVITQDMVSGGDITLANLVTVLGSSYDKKSYMPTTDWMARLLED